MENEILKIIPKMFQASAISLDSVGVDEIAWPRQTVLSIIKTMKSHNIAILGGDVLIKENNNYKYENSNWHIEMEKEEKWSDFVFRSHEVSQMYIEKFNEKENNNYIYTIICCKENEYENL